MSFSQVMAILRARWIIVLTIIGLAVATTVAINAVLPKRYTASSKVMVDVKSPDPVAGVVLAGMLSPTYLATQGDVIRSGRVVERVIADLRLSESPEMQAAWQNLDKGKTPYIVWLSDRLSTVLKAMPSREANVIEIEYTAESPEGAAMFANAFTNAYMAVTGDLRTEPAKAFGSSFETLATQLRKRLLEAQAKLTAYQKEAGLMATDERLDIETARLSELSSQVTQIQAMVADASAKKRSVLSNGADVSYEGMTSQVINQIRSDIIGYQAKLGQAQEKYGSAHPQVRELEQTLTVLKQRLTAEYGRSSGMIDSSGDISGSRLAAAKVALEEQRQKLVNLREKRNAAAIMMRDVENLQRAYDVVQSRVSQAGMEVQAGTTSLAVLQRATAPASHSSPKSFLNTLIALVLGTVLACATAIGIELLDRRIRTNDDIALQLGLPLVGVLLRTENASKGLLTRKAPPWVIHRNLLTSSPNA